MTTYPEFTLAPVQEAPFYLDRDASTEKACQLIEDAAQKGAAIAAFGETWLAGHPYFHGTAGSPLQQKAVLEYITNGVEIPSSTTDRLCAAVRQAGIDVVIGIVELDGRTRAPFIAHCRSSVAKVRYSDAIANSSPPALNARSGVKATVSA